MLDCVSISSHRAVADCRRGIMAIAGRGRMAPAPMQAHLAFMICLLHVLADAAGRLSSRPGQANGPEHPGISSEQQDVDISSLCCERRLLLSSLQNGMLPQEPSPCAGASGSGCDRDRGPCGAGPCIIRPVTCCSYAKHYKVHNRWLDVTSELWVCCMPDACFRCPVQNLDSAPLLEGLAARPGLQALLAASMRPGAERGAA